MKPTINASENIPTAQIEESGSEGEEEGEYEGEYEDEGEGEDEEDDEGEYVDEEVLYFRAVVVRKYIRVNYVRRST
ncbi:hypothetical protein Glove_194g182 [Diversispora epigaea]|uniref:Uncharacterized protein n=1 Tax=Diversispora epigaea TaxID=1348612 RepID=A0A397IL54_9GLOM|nr:hypothetical protein Glove_194g181 [Diversispora epigaea]RHZ76739.1 hypothetical protein Glove_194g182 [Diversispora epigaea]